MVGELGMVSVGGGDQVMGVEAGEDRGLVTRTGVSHSDVSGRTWARVTGGCVPCPEARSVETRRQVTRGASVTSSESQSADTSQNPTRPLYYVGGKETNSHTPELAEAGERIMQVLILISTGAFLIPVAKYLPIAPKFRVLVTFRSMGSSPDVVHLKKCPAKAS